MPWHSSWHGHLYNMGPHGAALDWGKCKSNQNWLLWNFRGFWVQFTASDREKSLHKRNWRHAANYLRARMTLDNFFWWESYVCQDHKSFPNLAAIPAAKITYAHSSTNPLNSKRIAASVVQLQFRVIAAVVFFCMDLQQQKSPWARQISIAKYHLFQSGVKYAPNI